MPAGEPASRATLAELAALADVSISTVSKVLNGRTGVSEETRARIEALLHDHQYNRRNPGPNHAPLIEVLCFEIDSSWAAEAIAAIERLAREHGVGPRGLGHERPPEAGPGLDRGRAQPPPGRRHPGRLQPARGAEAAAPLAQHPLRDAGPRRATRSRRARRSAPRTGAARTRRRGT